MPLAGQEPARQSTGDSVYAASAPGAKRGFGLSHIFYNLSFKLIQ